MVLDDGDFLAHHCGTGNVTTEQAIKANDTISICRVVPLHYRMICALSVDEGPPFYVPLIIMAMGSYDTIGHDCIFTHRSIAIQFKIRSLY